MLPQTANPSNGLNNLLPPPSRDFQLRQNTVIDILPKPSLIAWVFGRGTVVWRIWPAVLIHTIFAAAVVTISLKTKYNLGIPNVLITVLGVVIGFVISYRASSGYDRYWAGRSYWCEVSRNARTLSRLIWFHVPLRVTPSSRKVVSTEQEIQIGMNEKIMALDLIEGLVISVKHHLRGEIGIFYEDLYHLVRPLHNHPHHRRHRNNLPGLFNDLFSKNDTAAPSHTTTKPSPLSIPQNPSASNRNTDPNESLAGIYGSGDSPPHIYSSIADEADVAFKASRNHHRPRATGRRGSSLSSRSSERQPLLPGENQPSSHVMEQIKSDLMPFGTIFRYFTGSKQVKQAMDTEAAISTHTGFKHHKKHASNKDYPLVAGGGYNIPLEILRSLSDWLAVLEERGNTPGTSLGSMHGCIQAFEATLAALEQVLTTPLPFVYSVHIRHTVWVYLFSLPFQLVRDFRWFTIPGVAVATFIYLGFIAAGEEIEQPFGYDLNDLDLDLFCNVITHVEIEQLKRTQGRNVVLTGSKQQAEPQSGIHELAEGGDAA